ncbi:MAG: hypothetical protein KJ630_07360 [Proteobacteria bacterium]|nr:hypothetical protein [Pseudomonadota bacterium]
MLRFLSVALVFFLTGCTPRHYIVRQPAGVTLSLEFPNAKKVCFASSADSYRVSPAAKNRNGEWVVHTTRDREFHYFYIVDGRVFVPDCQYREKDDFGAVNCIYQP